MSSLMKICLFQNKKTKMWIAGVGKEGSYEVSPKIQDAMLFYGWAADGTFSGKDYRCETVYVRKFHPPAPKMWKPKKATKSKSSAKSKSDTVTKSKSPAKKTTKAKKATEEPAVEDTS